MVDKKLIIADGHHRYETGAAYRNETDGQQGSNRLPMTFFNMSSPGLTILPTHRVVSNLPGFDSGTLLERAAAFFDPGKGDLTIEVFVDGRLLHSPQVFVGSRSVDAGTCLRDNAGLDVVVPPPPDFSRSVLVSPRMP